MICIENNLGFINDLILILNMAYHYMLIELKIHCRNHEIRVWIIGYAVESIYNDEWVYQYGIGDVDDYFEQKQCIHSKLEVKTDLNKSIEKITQDIEYIRFQHDKSLIEEERIIMILHSLLNMMIL